MAMAHAVEARLPFLAPKLLETCIQVPVEQNIEDGLEKVVLRKAFKHLLPKEIYLRKKAPFPANENLKVHMLIHKIFEKNIKQAHPKVWELLDKRSLQRLNKTYGESLKKLKARGNTGKNLNEWLPISREVEIRTSHVFAFLTLLRWYKLYFSP
jgi:asparagine synthetase B (glutamine-hydrolysing)